MTGIAFCRIPSGVIESEKPGGWVLGTSDRRGQDKSRKVRPVGRLEDGSNFRHAPNIASNPHNVSFFETLCHCAITYTLWQAE